MYLRLSFSYTELIPIAHFWTTGFRETVYYN